MAGVSVDEGRGVVVGVIVVVGRGVEDAGMTVTDGNGSIDSDGVHPEKTMMTINHAVKLHVRSSINLLDECGWRAPINDSPSILFSLTN